MGNCLGTRRQALKLIMERELKLEREQTFLLTSGCFHCKRSAEDWTCLDLGSCSCPPNLFASINPIENVLGGAFIRDGIHKNRFVFVMKRRMCDLRALIDKRMLNLLHMRTHGPPFQDMETVTMSLYDISLNMYKLHEHGVVHRDIKASNVLLDGMTFHYLMDFECALGAVGTGFWRAPEILEQVQRRVPHHEVVFTEKADIYSYGMLCYEVLTGCIPFDGHSQNDYNIVLGGRRPELPHNLYPVLRELILDCWNQDPQDRPTAREIMMTVHKINYK